MIFVNLFSEFEVSKRRPPTPGRAAAEDLRATEIYGR
jgi:hypothetical protein